MVRVSLLIFDLYGTGCHGGYFFITENIVRDSGSLDLSPSDLLRGEFSELKPKNVSIRSLK
ncbi:hypothetical protein AKJ66_04760 [candidate division MSBL1 archaeon SCGC-AAA259E22]|uniref:Uncharacterized protein n=1 Tax=candidate division MSBL1 archaeon SCGC-AAA259E22 TaxID=1698265 RepID=A0A133UCY0_9EURY|nr:hypothetical protein AKJ66_04760 [candidate division MSBL1 archaeon SCGC-AAA259E22]